MEIVTICVAVSTAVGCGVLRSKKMSDSLLSAYRDNSKFSERNALIRFELPTRVEHVVLHITSVQ